MSIIYYRSNGTGTHFLFLVKEVKTVNLVSLVGLIENGPLYRVLLISPYKMAPINGKEHPVVLQTFKNQQTHEKMKSTSKNILMCFIIAIVLYVDISYDVTSSFFEIQGITYWFIQIGFLSFLVLQGLLNAISYFKMYNAGSVVITSDQRRLLGIDNDDLGYKSPVPKQSPNMEQKVNASIISPSSFCVSSAAAVSRFNPFSSRLTSTQSPSFFENHNSPLSLSNNQLNQSLNSSIGLENITTSPIAQPLSLSQATTSPARSDGGSVLRSRSLNTSLRRSPGYTDDSISDMKEFNQYLKEQDESPLRASQEQTDVGASFWSFNRSVTDFSPMLRKYAYQIASRSPASAKKKADDVDDAGDSGAAEDLWKLAGALTQSEI